MRTKPYQYKLNLLRPGLILCAGMAVLFLAGLLLRLCGLKPAGTVLWFLAGVLLAVLLLLLAIEGHQDKVLYRMAKEEDPEIK